MFSNFLNLMGCLVILHAAYSAHHCKCHFFLSPLVPSSLLSDKGILLEIGIVDEVPLPPTDVSPIKFPNPPFCPHAFSSGHSRNYFRFYSFVSRTILADEVRTSTRQCQPRSKVMGRNNEPT
jgi:hypothetical protein